MKLILTLCCLFLFHIGIAQEIEKFTDWNQAASVAKKENKQILIILTGAEWCKPCVKMERNVLSTNEYKVFAQQKYVTYEINIPKYHDYNSKIMQEYTLFKNKYQSNALPCLILVDNDGNEITKITSGLSSLEKVITQLKAKL
jgi:thioredoxin-related protein